MLELENALARILAALPAPVTEEVPLDQAAGRVLAAGVLSPLDLPPFANSSMDGYAVRAADVAAAGPGTAVRLRLLGKIAAGESPHTEVVPGTCIRLFTGSPLPLGANAVVMQEDTQPAEPGDVLIRDPVKPGENVRSRGEDIRRGSSLGEGGDVMTPGRISLFAAVGSTHVAVGKRPAVALLASGSELRLAGETLRPGQIHESNRLALTALARGAGAVPRVLPRVGDSLKDTQAALAGAFEQSDILVTTGGVSVGEFDFIKSAFEAVGGRLEFWRVAIKPGRPFVFGRKGDKFLFGLPGNPASAFVTFLLLVRPALRRWQGAREVALPTHPATLAEPVANSGGRRHFLRVRVDAQGQVRLAGIQASHALSSLAAANALLDLPPGATLPAGAVVSVSRWDWP